ncbi:MULTISPECIES: HupE/UreJ family protein [Pseudanabaena]|uniref:Hydrogenase accessory protein n=2 Tax=Pseudanabaena TaxID=1152 RepID=L8N1N5_9CYAN|nr:MULTISPECIES: HupE/UreJ family protein [Pseudanabaena]ELS32158.1 hydrogenase accessory protein [Pseudanabaena biceps PCC 7429]MDG3495594.1 HupE/UreJ family protein [Pseudanabaena catenata USMAC16]
MNFSKLSSSIQSKILVIAFGFSLLLFASPASAHHAMGGRMPSNFFEGFMSGLAHPVIGVDHLAFIVAVGLFAAIKSQGILIPVSFVLSAMLGTGIHLLGVNLPVVELIVSASILLFGILLARKHSPNILVMIALSAAAGLFHGYAYGEAIFGAQTTALVAYLCGFTVIQLVISGAAFWIGQKVLKGDFAQAAPNLRSAGLVICGIGAAFLASNISSLILPAPKV